jgi:hypothetical protein
VSLDAQRAKVKAYAELYDLELLEVIVDAGESAKSLDRPGLKRAFDSCRTPSTPVEPFLTAQPLVSTGTIALGVRRRGVWREVRSTVRISVGTPPNLPDFLQFCFSSAFVAPLLPPTGPRCSSNRIAWLSDAGERCM